MPLIILFLAALLLLGPQIWARHVIAKHSKDRDDLPGTGGELAKHLLTTSGFDGYSVQIDTLSRGDHFDPLNRTIVLKPNHYEKRSLSAAVVAAHEFGHAIQLQIGYRPLLLRSRLVVAAAAAERLASVLLLMTPIVSLVAKTPVAGVGVLAFGIVIMTLPILVHLVTLPVEFDASFNRALPILRKGYLGASDLKDAKTILLACSLTYVAASLASLLNFWRWLKFIRR